MAEMYSKNGRALSSTQNLKGEPTEIESSKKFNANNAFLTQLKKDEFLNGSIPITLNSKGEYVTDLVFNNIMKIRQDDKFPKEKDEENESNNNDNFLASVKNRKERKVALDSNTALRENLNAEEEEFLNAKLGEVLHQCMGDDYIALFSNTKQGFTIGQDQNMQAIYGQFINAVCRDREALARKIFSPQLLKAFSKYNKSRNSPRGINADSMFFERLKMISPKFADKDIKATYHSINTLSGFFKNTKKHRDLCLEIDNNIYRCIDSKQQGIQLQGQTTFRNYAHRGHEKGEAFTSEVAVYQTKDANGPVCYGKADYDFAPNNTKSIDIDGTLPRLDNGDLTLTLKTPCNTSKDEKVALCFSTEHTTPPKVRYDVAFGEGKKQKTVSMEDLHKLFNCCPSFNQWINELGDERNVARILNTDIAQKMGLEINSEGKFSLNGMKEQLRHMHDVYDTVRNMEKQGLMKYNGENIEYASAMPYEPLPKRQSNKSALSGEGGVTPVPGEGGAGANPSPQVPPSPSRESLQNRINNEIEQITPKKIQEKQYNDTVELLHTRPKKGLSMRY